MNICIIGQDRDGSRVWFMKNELQRLGHDVQTANSDTLTKHLPRGESFHHVENCGKPIPLSALLPPGCEWVLIVQNYLHFTNDVHPNIIVGHWFAEPYFAPSCREAPLWLLPDQNYEGTMLQWYKWESCKHVLHQVDFPFCCPVTTIESHEQAYRDLKGLNFLANLDFGYKLEKLAYFESIALRDRKRFMELALHMKQLTVHQYPQPWHSYRSIVERSEFMLVVPGGGCTVNQQLTECLSAGTIPVLFVENAEAKRAFDTYGLIHGDNCIQFEDEPTFIDAMGIMNNWARHPEIYRDRSRKCRALAELRSYALAATELVKAFETTRQAVKNLDQFEADIKRQQTIPSSG